ncbi:hypothetical protein [Streptomyces sp. S.PB5]|uniref:hypothetical protein n=1 Tax=Streptomyces sp. S.PB5 TaxID=3020844 RepID=UPI0025B27E90|nr:hypothetical protein [Streptomyces sp. S.PB5]MDN3022765.1 hypothetical protein [Streptomyces sp. S.PB5]
MATEHRQRPTTQIGSRPLDLLAQHGCRPQLRAASPTHDAFVSRLVDDMNTLLKEFEETFETGRR